MYYLSSCLFGLALVGVIIHNIIFMFICMSLVGLFSQLARTSNRIYFQEDIASEHRGKILSIVMMDRGMIPLGSLILTTLSEIMGPINTFITMGIFTFVIAFIAYIIQRPIKLEVEYDSKRMAKCGYQYTISYFKCFNKTFGKNKLLLQLKMIN